MQMGVLATPGTRRVFFREPAVLRRHRDCISKELHQKSTTAHDSVCVFGPSRTFTASNWAVAACTVCIGAVVAFALGACWPVSSIPVVKSFAPDPQNIIQGQTGTLSWSVRDATSLSISEGIGMVTGNSISVAPAVTTTYAITATNNAGTATAKTTVVVTPLPPSAAVPILLITSASNPFSNYYTEILNAEGFNAYVTADISTVTQSKLKDFGIVIIGEMPLTAEQVSMFAFWVYSGGNLIAMRPDEQLGGLLGIARVSGAMADKYVGIDVKRPPGTGITATTIQFHGSADLHTLGSARAVATLYSDAVTPTAHPAVTLRSIGAGSAAAFTFDLARSVVYTRQGNPAWAGQDRNGDSVIRSGDLFYPDYLDLSKSSIPQADEMQRLFGNLILMMQSKGNKMPLPRLWYFPNMYKAIIVAAGDDHGTFNGTKSIFNKFLVVSPAGCSVADWQCFRATSWIFSDTPLSPAAARKYQAQGFDIGSHVTTASPGAVGCKDFESMVQLDAIFTVDIRRFVAAFPGLPAQRGNRMHCDVWSDWASVPKVEKMHGIRFDMSYYSWPPSWINKPGFITGSGIPMRYADRDGAPIDVYQQATHWVNENGPTWAAGIESMINLVLGPDGYYGAFGTHYDYRGDGFPELLLRLARRYGIPIVSAQQMLAWVDGRNASNFRGMTWDGSRLTFTLTAARDTRGMYAMLPIDGQPLLSITFNGSAAAFTTSTVKGVAYALFPAHSGQYVATYGTASLLSAVSKN